MTTPNSNNLKPVYVNNVPSITDYLLNLWQDTVPDYLAEDVAGHLAERAIDSGIAEGVDIGEWLDSVSERALLNILDTYFEPCRTPEPSGDWPEDIYRDHCRTEEKAITRDMAR